MERADDGGTPLHWAATTNSLDTSSLLIKSGADVNAVNDVIPKIQSLSYFFGHLVYMYLPCRRVGHLCILQLTDLEQKLQNC